MEKVIYIIDDSKFMLKILEEKILQIDSSIKLLLYNDPNLLRVEDVNPNTVAMIVDYNMPKMNGIEFILKFGNINDKITYVLLSASSKNSSSSTVGLPKKLRFIQKPIADSDLEKIIKEL